MRLVKMKDGSVLNADAICCIVQGGSNLSSVYFVGGAKLTYPETPIEVAEYIHKACISGEALENPMV
jgi:hypothetical protein